MSIHPTAIIGSEVRLGKDVTVGPYACMEGEIVIGNRCVIQSHAILTGRLSLGEDNTVGYGAVLGAHPQDLAFDPATKSEVIIGSRNILREHVTIHRGTAAGSATVIGNDNFLMAGAHLGHNCRLGDRCIIANNALLGGHVHVEDRVFIGGGCVFHQFVRVGRLAIAQGASAFSKDIPPFTIGAERNSVAGLNVVGLRRAGFDAAQREEVKRAFKLLYSSGMNVTQALEAARSQTWGPEAAEFFNFAHAAKKRGLCDLRSST